jgi:hypothetical protein
MTKNFTIFNDHESESSSERRARASGYARTRNDDPVKTGGTGDAMTLACRASGWMSTVSTREVRRQRRHRRASTARRRASGTGGEGGSTEDEEKAGTSDGVTTTTTTTTTRSGGGTETARAEAKARLLDACAGTYRGALASREDREAIAAAQGALERLSEDALDFDALDGKWRLAYTNASDVVGLLVASQRLGVPEVGDIFQSFGCADGSNTGITNEIRLSVPFLLNSAKKGEPGGVGLRVQASFKKVDKRRIALTFQEAQVSEISISPLAETLLAPAILPRGSINHQILMFIKELELKFPLRGALTSIGGGGEDGGAAVGSYNLTYCDDEVLVGRAAAGGVYIFTRA